MLSIGHGPWVSPGTPRSKRDGRPTHSTAYANINADGSGQYVEGLSDAHSVLCSCEMLCARVQRNIDHSKINYSKLLSQSTAGIRQAVYKLVLERADVNIFAL